MTILAAVVWFLSMAFAALIALICLGALVVVSISRYVCLAALMLLSLGCAQKPVVAPSGAAVASGIAQTQTHIATAQDQNKSLTGYNAQQRTLAQRIHDKDILIDRWRETHRQ